MGVRANVVAAMMLLIGMVVAASAAWAGGMKVDPGKWEFTSTAPSMMSTEPTERTTTQCVTSSEFDPALLAQRAQTCEISEVAATDDSMTWKIACTVMGKTATGGGSVKSTGSTVTGSVKMVVPFGSQKMELNTDVKGKRVGDCD